MPEIYLEDGEILINMNDFEYDDEVEEEDSMFYDKLNKNKEFENFNEANSIFAE